MSFWDMAFQILVRWGENSGLLRMCSVFNVDSKHSEVSLAFLVNGGLGAVGRAGSPEEKTLSFVELLASES